MSFTDAIAAALLCFLNYSDWVSEEPSGEGHGRARALMRRDDRALSLLNLEGSLSSRH